MSLMTAPQGRPHAVYSLIRLIAKCGPLDEADISAWMIPAAPKGGSNTRLKATIECARSLGFITKVGTSAWMVNEEPVQATFEEFLDSVHDRVCRSASPDRNIVSAYAVVAAKCEEQEGTTWLRTEPDVFSATVRAAMPRGELFNEERMAAWREWVCALGLGYGKTGALGIFFPRPTERIRRVLGSVSEFQEGGELIAPVFLERLSAAMPYLDGGEVWKGAARALELGPRRRRLSAVLSGALQDLHRDGQLVLLHRGGDHKHAWQLAPGQGPEAFEAVRTHA